MMIFASVGSVLNLFVLWQIRHLRDRPSAAWRRSPISARQARSERLQMVLSLVTLILVAAEFFTHRILHP